MTRNGAKTARGRGIQPGFVAPDGGWGWYVVLAAGCSNLSTFPVLQQFGLLFRDRLTDLGLSGKQITTIINLNSCLTSCLGLLNGPMFRRFTYRQVAFFGAILSAIGILCTSVASTFGAYVLTFSVLYGAGTGINSSASALALNTYFKEKRRIATGISWTATALGPIVFPQVIALLIPLYGVQGTVLLFGGLAINAVALALVYQPVEWHTRPADAAVADDEQTGDLCAHCVKQQQQQQHQPQPEIGGYAIVDPGTPMLSAANDGWFSATPAKRSIYSSRVSLASGFVSRKTSYANLQSAAAAAHNNHPTGRQQQSASNAIADEDAPPAEPVRSNRASFVNLSKEAKRDKLKLKTAELKIDEADAEDCPSFKAPQDLVVKASEPPTPAVNAAHHQPMFIINGDFRRKTSSVKRPAVNGNADPAAAAATSALHDEQHLMATVPTGWLQVKSTVPSRNQSALSIFDMTPRRNFSATSFHAEKQVLRDVRHQLQQYVSDCGECTCGYHVGGGDGGGPGQVDDGGDKVAAAEEAQYTWWQRLFIFFDLDLLRDWSYVNLMVGVTIASFAELNYSILTPFVLAEYGLTKAQTATSMSLLGAMDISVRFFVPFAAGRIGWENKTFFLFGVLGMALGRISIAHFHTYPAVLAASVWIGLNKGLRTVFMALVIPSYVPLDRLPGATGLQLLFAGIFYFVVGPVIGWIRDTTNYTVTLHCLNIATFTTAICWGAEKWYQDRKARRKTTAADTLDAF